MKILFTGASSFTGYWFVKALAEAGHEVVCPLRGSPAGYSGLRQRRVRLLEPLARLIPELPFGAEGFLRLMREQGPFALLCHHAADVANYKSSDFDPVRALANNTLNLRAVLDQFGKQGGKGVVLTGTFFEADEGAGPGPKPAFSPYGVSKGLTWQVFRFYCASARLPLGKFVLPNPFGPLEEPRFTTYLMNTWRTGKVAQVKSPDYRRDNIHADLLAGAYGVFCQRLAGEALGAGEPPGELRLNPSGYAETNAGFAERIARETRRRTGWRCELEILKQEDFNEPLERTNVEPAAGLVPSWNESKAWDGFVEFYT